jgi:hypothetical protein
MSLTIFYFFSSSGRNLFILLNRFTLAEWVKKQLRGEEPELPCVTQLRTWSKVGDPMHKHFKSIARVANPEEFSGWTVRSLISQYNGKPFLSNKTHTMERHGDKLVLCFDVHSFSFLARKSYFEQVEMFPKLILDIGFVVESRESKYLPECLLGCVRIMKFDPETELVGISDRF